MNNWSPHPDGRRHERPDMSDFEFYAVAVVLGVCVGGVLLFLAFNPRPADAQTPAPVEFRQVVAGTKNVEGHVSPDGRNDWFFYLAAFPPPFTLIKPPGAWMELAGNNVWPASSRGRAQLTSGYVPEGAVSLNPSHPESALLVQTDATNVLKFWPFYGYLAVFRDLYLAADSTNRRRVTLARSVSLAVEGGTGGRIGTATLSGGQAAVANTSVTARTVVFLTRKEVLGTPGELSHGVNPGAGFTVRSTSNADASVVKWLLVEEAG